MRRGTITIIKGYDSTQWKKDETEGACARFVGRRRSRINRPRRSDLDSLPYWPRSFPSNAKMPVSSNVPTKVEFYELVGSHDAPFDKAFFSDNSACRRGRLVLPPDSPKHRFVMLSLVAQASLEVALHSSQHPGGSP